MTDVVKPQEHKLLILKEDFETLDSKNLGRFLNEIDIAFEEANFEDLVRNEPFHSFEKEPILRGIYMGGPYSIKIKKMVKGKEVEEDAHFYRIMTTTNGMVRVSAIKQFEDNLKDGIRGHMIKFTSLEKKDLSNGVGTFRPVNIAIGPRVIQF